MSVAICSMYRVARGMTSGVVIRSAAASARNARQVALGERLDRLAGRRRAADDLVVDVGDVHDPRHAQAAPAQVTDEQVGEQERAEVADVRRAVDRRPAGIHPDVVRRERDQRPRLARQRVLQPDRHRGAPTVATTSAEIDRPAPSAPSRLPVDAFTLTAPGSSPRRAAILSRIGSSQDAEPWPRSDDGQVDARRSPAGSFDASPDLVDQDRCWRCRAGCGRRAGTDARDRPDRRPRAAHRRRHGGRHRRPSDRPGPARP